ncbi:MAG: ferritin-like domain-containing protein [Planctomycetota bacterium]|nr:ferritin-like domain-containing protein [Planctomycetota bacterium]
MPKKDKARTKGKVDKQTRKIIEELIVSYWMEMETVLSYICNSVNLDGVRAEEIKKSLQVDIQAELGHATQLARRINVLGGVVPGSMDFRAMQKSLQPRADTTDVAAVIRGVIEAENGAIAQYRKIIKLCDGFDYATQDLCITLLENEEAHRREFIGFLTEYEKK